mmetsp:Transcript_15153/g.37992  ORF Transcript_15153/g.37992 Transcript_15153/m.37992 type:complete len:371 (-) Transcript_15153:934-2046(-)
MESAPALPMLGLVLRLRCSKDMREPRCSARAWHPSSAMEFVPRSSCWRAEHCARAGARSETPLLPSSLSLRSSTWSLGAWKATASASALAPLWVMPFVWSSRRRMPGTTCMLLHRCLQPSSWMPLPHRLSLVRLLCTSSRGASVAAPRDPRGGRLECSSRVASKGLVMTTSPTTASLMTWPPLACISSQASLACSGVMAVGTATLQSLRSTTSSQGKPSNPDRRRCSTPSLAKSWTGVALTRSSSSATCAAAGAEDQGPSPPMTSARPRERSDFSRIMLYLRMESLLRTTASSTAVLYCSSLLYQSSPLPLCSVINASNSPMIPAASLWLSLRIRSLGPHPLARLAASSVLHSSDSSAIVSARRVSVIAR